MTRQERRVHQLLVHARDTLAVSTNELRRNEVWTRDDWTRQRDRIAAAREYLAAADELAELMADRVREVTP